MDLRCAIAAYVIEGRELLDRLRSAEEGPTAQNVDLHILRVQAFLIDTHVANMQELRRLQYLTKPGNLPRKTDPSRLSKQAYQKDRVS